MQLLFMAEDLLPLGAMFYFLAFNSGNALILWRNEGNLKAMFSTPGPILAQDMWLDAK